MATPPPAPTDSAPTAPATIEAAAGSTPTPTSARRTTSAAAIFIVMFLVSATGAIWSAWLLMHGEDTDPVFKALPGDCDAVVLLDRPAEVGPSLQRLAQHPGTPAALVALATAWRGPLAHSASLAGLDTGQTWAVCKRGPVWLAALVAARNPGENAPKWLDDWRSGLGSRSGGAWAPRGELQVQTGADGKVLAALKSAPGLWIVAFRDPELPADTTATADPAQQLLALATQTEAASLVKDKEFRESIERVGGGQARIFVRGALAQRWLLTQLPEQGALAPWRRGVPELHWAAAALRDDGDAVHLQVHLGTAQRGVIFLKDHLDIQADQDLAALLPAELVRGGEGGTVRLTRRSWPMLPPALAPTEQLGAAFPDFADRRDWSQWLAGPVAWLRTGNCLLALAPLRAGAQLPADAPAPQGGPRCALERRILGQTLAVGTAPELDRAATWLADPAQQLAGAHPDADLARLARDTQGWTAWPGQQRVQIDWVWLDTGLAGALTVWPQR